MIRATGFFVFGSAYWALLPLIARGQMQNGAALYGLLLGMIGLGSILGSVALNWLKERLGPDGLRPWPRRKRSPRSSCTPGRRRRSRWRRA